MKIFPLTLIAGAFLFCTQSGFSAEAVSITLSFEPDLRNGQRTYETCASCHLPEGWGSSDGAYPQIAGQHQQVLIKQLLDIRDGHRENSIMYPFVQERTIGGYQSIVDVVSYITRLPMHPQHQKGPMNDLSDGFKSGQKLYQQQCAACHGKQAEGNNSLRIPKLYGQHYPYMMRQIGQIKSGLRTVDPGMKAIADRLSEDELKTIINYISYIPVPEQELAPSLNWRNTDFY